MPEFPDQAQLLLASWLVGWLADLRDSDSDEEAAIEVLGQSQHKQKGAERKSEAP